MATNFLSALKKRRSQYALGKNISQSPDEIRALITETMRHTPSAFHSQSSRAVILFGDENVEFWTLIENHLRDMVPAENFGPTEEKLRSFAAGVGTVLFFEDMGPVTDLQERFALYAEHFPTWSEHASGMAQFAVWTALATANIGASLQHYIPFADEAIRERWNIPNQWVLRAQMPFGSVEGEPMEKTFIEDDERIKVFG
ncbi:MAG TPA: nitroreductase family protein [Paenalcaligenes sp.]|nr:nitroreductase family protein [Paenalcaligenes sp.]